MTLKEMILKHLDLAMEYSGDDDTSFSIQSWLIREYCSNSYLHEILHIPLKSTEFNMDDYRANGAVVSDLFDLPLTTVIAVKVDDIVHHINENIENGTIVVNNELFGSTVVGYSIIDMYDSDITLMDVCNIDYLLSYMPDYINESSEKVDLVKKSIREITTYTNARFVNADILTSYMEANTDYTRFSFQALINGLHENINKLSSFIDQVKAFELYNFIGDDIAASKTLGNHPIYHGEFSTLVFVENDSYVRHYLTNKNGFRDLLQLCLAKNYLIMEQYGDHRMFVYLNDSIDKLDEINELDNLLIGMLKSTNRL